MRAEVAREQVIGATAALHKKLRIGRRQAVAAVLSTPADTRPTSYGATGRVQSDESDGLPAAVLLLAILHSKQTAYGDAYCSITRRNARTRAV